MYCEAYAGYIYLFPFLYGRYKGFRGVMDMYIVWDASMYIVPSRVSHLYVVNCTFWFQ